MSVRCHTIEMDLANQTTAAAIVTVPTSKPIKAIIGNSIDSIASLRDVTITDTKCSSRARHAIGGWRESLFLRQLAVNRLNEENYLRNQIAESNPFGRRRLRKNALMLNAAVMLRSDPLEYLLGITQAASGQVERNANEDISAIRSVRTRSRRLERRDDAAGFGASVQRSRLR